MIYKSESFQKLTTTFVTRASYFEEKMLKVYLMLVLSAAAAVFAESVSILTNITLIQDPIAVIEPNRVI